MRTHATFYIFAVLMAVLTFSAPFVAIAQQNLAVLEARAMAAQDAESDVNKGVWFGSGCLVSAGTLLVFLIVEEPTPEMCGLACLFHGAALAVPFVYSPPLPSSRLLGKSPEYVESYTKAYKKRTRWLRTSWAVAGASTGCGLGLCLLGVIVSRDGLVFFP